MRRLAITSIVSSGYLSVKKLCIYERQSIFVANNLLIVSINSFGPLPNPGLLLD